LEILSQTKVVRGELDVLRKADIGNFAVTVVTVLINILPV